MWYLRVTSLLHPNSRIQSNPKMRIPERYISSLPFQQ